MNLYDIIPVRIIVKTIPMVPAQFNFRSKHGLAAIIGKTTNNNPGEYLSLIHISEPTRPY